MVIVSVRIDKIAGKIPINLKMSIYVRILPTKDGTFKSLLGKFELYSDHIWKLKVPKHKNASISFQLFY